MRPAREVVVTGVGIVSPIGIGREAFWSSLMAGRSGVRTFQSFDASGFGVRFGAEVLDFDPKAFVRPRKSLKVMSREIQLGFAAADTAPRRLGLRPVDRRPGAARRGLWGRSDLFGIGRVGPRLSPRDGSKHIRLRPLGAECDERNVSALVAEVPTKHDSVSRGDRPRRPRTE